MFLKRKRVLKSYLEFIAELEPVFEIVIFGFAEMCSLFTPQVGRFNIFELSVQSSDDLFCFVSESSVHRPVLFHHSLCDNIEIIVLLLQGLDVLIFAAFQLSIQLN